MAEKKQIQDIFSVKGKVCVITGGAGFLGLHYADFLSQMGAKVVILDSLDKNKIEKLVKGICKRGTQVMGFSVDITSESEVKKAVSDILKKFLRIDVLINNAAMNPAVGDENSKKQFAPIDDYSLELWKREMEVNLTGMFICAKAVIPAMKKQGRGVIVNVASEVSVIAHDHRVYNEANKYKSSAYVASKTGVVGLTRALAAQLGRHNIRVNALSPGGVENPKMSKDFIKRFGETNMLSRMAKPDEYNSAILFLCSDASSFMTGHNLVIDGGKSAW